MPMGKGYGGAGGSRSKSLGMAMDEGTSGKQQRPVAKQSGGSSGVDFPGAFGKGSGSTAVDGVTYEGAAKSDAARNVGRNYNVVESSARKFGSGGVMKG